MVGQFEPCYEGVLARLNVDAANSRAQPPSAIQLCMVINLLILRVSLYDCICNAVITCERKCVLQIFVNVAIVKCIFRILQNKQCVKALICYMAR